MVRTVDIVPSTQDEDFIWPNDCEIRKLQAKRQPPAGSNVDRDLTAVNNKICIPSQATNMQFRLLRKAHTDAAGHKGIDAITSMLRDRSYLNGLNVDVQVLVHACLHCFSSRKRERVPRTLMLTTNAVKKMRLYASNSCT